MRDLNKYDTENHERQFTGWFIPAEVVFMHQAGEIGDKELLLLATIDSLVRRGRGRGKHGCYATNRWLANEVHSTPKSTSILINRLVKKRLVFSKTSPDGRRVLTTRWSGSRIQ